MSNWQLDLLRASLGPLDLLTELSPQVRAYQSFYGLDLPQRSAVQSRLGWVQVQDYAIAMQCWWPPAPIGTLVVLHGYYDHMGLYRHVVDWGVSLGLAVLACDLPGHGLSTGPVASINEFAEYQQVLNALLAEARRLDLPTPWHLLGQSTGAAIVLDYLLHQPEDPAIGKSILLAPLVRPYAWQRSLWLYQSLRHFVKQLPRRYSINSGDQDFLAFIRTQDPLQAKILPVAWVGALDRWIRYIEATSPCARAAPLIVQGELDFTVDWPYNLAVLAQKFQAPPTLLLPTARHHLANEQEALRNEYFAFLRERVVGC